MGINPGMTPGEALDSAGIASEHIAAPDEEEDFPWHDSALPIVDRMELAEGKPFERKLMAAMAQLDCGSCGYVCQTYAESIAAGQESNLTLCSPGGKETKQMIKKLLREDGNNQPAQSSPNDVPVSSGWSRQNPFSAKLLESRPLNQQGSAKDTRHVVIDLAGSGLRYDVGDALGVYPTNCPDLATMIIQELSTDPELNVESPTGSKKTLLQTLIEDVCLRDPSDELIELLVARTQSASAKRTLQSFAEEGTPEGCDVLDVLSVAVGARVTATEFLETLEPLNPRLYSIASSMKKVGEQVHLTVGKVTYQRQGRLRKGVASTMLAERIDEGNDVRVFVQPNHGGFTVPRDSAAPMIMVGPGTGIAPFIAFLQERDANGCQGDNWLFFGDRHQATDFLYRDTLRDYVQRGVLTRLDTAFSRDHEAKIYVQDKMRENGAELYRWIQRGAYFFVCGDAGRMANDVNHAWRDIVASHGGMSVEDAELYLDQLKNTQRYVQDVY